MIKISVLDFLKKMIAGTLTSDITSMKYPTAISKTLKMKIIEIEYGKATVEIEADDEIHGNQQGTVHGGLLCELADAAIGTAHSTVIGENESFTSLEFKINFFRPVWKDSLRAIAKPVQSGKTITVYNCEIKSSDGKTIALASSTVMTLRGEKAIGR
ncbi:thioesterase [Flavobacterium psychrophilum]|uniref:Thioesterase domain-containing protein n=1 Tax=Flavobacterium psychrophilum (strain ATCC 49511 / DSM 21280 / CIP 103535 / JIP02/86) TaxID=402612 RepID=A6GZX2_FLAPJ|nr:PaaI family thioesterase [Flavobacterium psychrophilum]AIG30337.1 thioesterase [Flavobacterium psychrophilum]AIG32612.1 thioesterase [Flavobacterium psychrophilum]AIG34767.1 thioesterase [Flavobacterium psychrophilum]AIG37132.1 thioesterase [Flavobacterium psychrophilum]AIG39396.1 thioesterase [Flavobacterium psychrophilum]